MLTKVIGVGSPYGDDTIGFRVVSWLQKTTTHPNIHFDIQDRPGVGLLSCFLGWDKVIIIDAMRSGRPRGAVLTFTKEALGHYKSATSSHDLGVVETMQLGAALGMLPKHWCIIGIEVENGNVGFSDEEVRVLAEAIEKEFV